MITIFKHIPKKERNKSFSLSKEKITVNGPILQLWRHGQKGEKDLTVSTGKRRNRLLKVKRISIVM